jgi:hypothetical protein
MHGDVTGMLNSSLDDTGDVLSSNTSMLGCVSPPPTSQVAGNQKGGILEDTKITSESIDTLLGDITTHAPDPSNGLDSSPPPPPQPRSPLPDSEEKRSGFRARLVARKLANEERSRSITPPNTEMDDFEASKSPDSIPSPKRSLIPDLSDRSFLSQVGERNHIPDMMHEVDYCSVLVDSYNEGIANNEVLQLSPAQRIEQPRPIANQSTPPLPPTSSTRYSSTSLSEAQASTSSTPMGTSPITALIALHTMEMSRGNQDKWPLNSLYLENESKIEIEVDEMKIEKEVDKEEDTEEENEEEGKEEKEAEVIVLPADEGDVEDSEVDSPHKTDTSPKKTNTNPSPLKINAHSPPNEDLAEKEVEIGLPRSSIPRTSPLSIPSPRLVVEKRPSISLQSPVLPNGPINVTPSPIQLNPSNPSPLNPSPLESDASPNETNNNPSPLKTDACPNPSPLNTNAHSPPNGHPDYAHSPLNEDLDYAHYHQDDDGAYDYFADDNPMMPSHKSEDRMSSNSHQEFSGALGERLRASLMADNEDDSHLYNKEEANHDDKDEEIYDIYGNNDSDDNDEYHEKNKRVSSSSEGRGDEGGDQLGQSLGFFKDVYNDNDHKGGDNYVYAYMYVLR